MAEPVARREGESGAPCALRLAASAFVRFVTFRTTAPSEAKLRVRGGLAIALAGVGPMSPGGLREAATLAWEWWRTRTPRGLRAARVSAPCAGAGGRGGG